MALLRARSHCSGRTSMPLDGAAAILELTEVVVANRMGVTEIFQRAGHVRFQMKFVDASLTPAARRLLQKFQLTSPPHP